MGWYRGSKLSLDKLHYAAMGSKCIARNPFQQPISGNASQLFDQRKVGTTSSLLSSRFCHLGGLRESRKTQLFNAGRRYYHVDRYQVSHFKPRDFEKLFEYPWNVLIVVLLSSGVVITVHFCNLESIPYTMRTHFVLMSRDLEMRLGEFEFKLMKARYNGKFLPDVHPDSVRLRLILKDVIEALHRDTRHEQLWSDPNYATQYLDHDNWEVIVVDHPRINACCINGGKIIVFTGLLKHFKSDAEIATIIGHEVAHAVARHSAEKIPILMWLTIVQLILFPCAMLHVVNAIVSIVFLLLPFSRKLELEADYIGLLLTASSGYDPRVAPTVYEKLEKIVGGSALDDYLSTHPSGKKRAQLLAQSHVMQEAITVYREVKVKRRRERRVPVEDSS